MSEKKALNKIKSMINNHLNSPYGDEGECLTEEDRSLDRLAKKIYDSIEIDADEIVTLITNEFVRYRSDEKFKFNARMSGKNWTIANWLAKAIAVRKPIKIKVKK